MHQHGAAAQDTGWCEDTDYGTNSSNRLLKSKVHLIQLFGDASYRSTNYFVDDYEGMVTFIEGRVTIPRLSELSATKLPLPDPYVVAIAKGLKDIDWEDRLDYGVGIEWRPFKRVEKIRGNPFSFLGHVRFYSVYLKTEFFQYKWTWSWRPTSDTRFGFDLYRECNFYSRSRFWAETWMDVSWRKTNFFIDDFSSWTAGFVPKFGIKWFPRSAFTIMPYVTMELSATEQSDFWTNRLISGVGIRMMPFRWKTGFLGGVLAGTRIYWESGWLVSYLKDEAPEDTPELDTRFGVGLTLNAW